jgi:branched-chain amino acid transport system permease protein
MKARSIGFEHLLSRGVGVAALLLAVIAPALISTPLMSAFFVSAILTQALFLGIAAASLIFLSAYGGMVSLAQVAIFGIAGFALGNAVTNGNSKGLNLGWNPWWGVLIGIVAATVIAFLLGALASRSAGIYFLMITLTYAVIANVFFGANLSLSGFGGISGIKAPGFVGDVNAHPNRLYYAALVVAVVVYAVLRYLVRTPFGLALQGVRDDPVRMGSLGYNVALHRTMAFGLAGFVASLGGVLFVWWNGHIDPASINIGAAIDLLVICVIGGLYRLEGAWVGALAFVLIQNYVRTDSLPIVGGTFHTLIGVIFLVIILVSPGGLMGIWESLVRRLVKPQPVAAIAVPAPSDSNPDGGHVGRPGT